MVVAWKDWFDAHVYLSVFVATVLEGLGLPVPAEILFLATAGLVHAGEASLLAVILTAVAGNMAGSLSGFGLAYVGGPALLARVTRVIGLKPAAMHQVQRFFERYGPVTVFLSRFVGFIRAATVYVSGSARMNPLRFALYLLAASAVWNAGWAYLAVRFGAHLPRLVHEKLGHWAVLALSLTVVAALVGVWVKRRRTLS